MDITSTVGAIFFVVIFSTLFAIMAKQKFSNKNMEVGNEEFFFYHNETFLSICSNVGTFLSLTFYICACFILGYKYKYLSYISIIVGIALFWTLFIFVANRCPKFMRKDGRGVLSALVHSKIEDAYFIYIVMIVAAGLIVIASEIYLLSMFLNKFIGENNLSMFVYIFFIISFCTMYVRHGGFLGTLLSDKFQLCIFVVWLLVTTIFISFEILNLPTLDSYYPAKTSSGVDNSPLYLVIIQILCLSIYFMILQTCCMGLWTRIFGTLDSTKDIKKSIHLTFFIVILVSLPAMYIGHHYSHLLIPNTDYLSAPILALYLLVQDACREDVIWLYYPYKFLTISAMIAISLTTIDSLLIFIMQNFERLNEYYASFYEKYFSFNAMIPLLIMMSVVISLSFFKVTPVNVLHIVFIYLIIALYISWATIYKSLYVCKVKASGPWYYILYAFSEWFWPKKWVIPIVIVSFLVSVLISIHFNLLNDKTYLNAICPFIIFPACSIAVNAFYSLLRGKEHAKK